MIRIFDFFASLIGLILLSPVMIGLVLLVVIDSGFPVYFVQERVGKDGKLFSLFKFRTMKTGQTSKSLLTIGTQDERITRAGYYLRRFKLDEIPQLFNVMLGDMSFVGPRPEVMKYVELYNETQKKVLKVRPGITDLASLEYLDEDELLGKAENPEKTYIEDIMPHKLEINLKYLEKRNLITDIGVIIKTILKILS